MLLTNVVDAYLAKQRSLGMRFESAEILLRQFCRAIGNRDIAEVTPRGGSRVSPRPRPAQCDLDAAIQGLKRPLPIRASLELAGRGSDRAGHHRRSRWRR
ncbi:hypothetical protein [Mesorhizobium temperatum]|uniref:hypothetical protein n=1 Tax=Mesorhizobium temperatum TaxID=241416 RepID=UPI00142DE0F5|nr:hypothetical protein [Mesorhizobium temperatum]